MEALNLVDTCYHSDKCEIACKRDDFCYKYQRIIIAIVASPMYEKQFRSR